MDRGDTGQLLASARDYAESGGVGKNCRASEIVLAQASLASVVVHATGGDGAAPFTSSRIPIHFPYFPCFLALWLAQVFFLFWRVLSPNWKALSFLVKPVSYFIRPDARFPIPRILYQQVFCPLVYNLLFSFLILIHYFFVYSFGDIWHWAFSLFARCQISTGHSFGILPQNNSWT